MSITRGSTCLVEGCVRHHIIVDADISQVRRHYYSHDYKELQQTASKLGLINDNENRGRSWLVRKLADLSILKGIEL